MLASDIITETRGIITETDPTNSHVTDSQLLAWINQCTLQLMSYIGTYPKGLTTVACANTITLAESLLSVDQVTVLNTSNRHQILQTIDFSNFVRLFADWQDQSSGIPTHFVRMGVLNWMVYPNPNSDFLGKDMQIYAKTLPTDITTSQEPPVSIALHSCYPFYVAWKAFLALNSPDKAKDAFTTFDSLRKMNTSIATTTMGTLKSLRMDNYNTTMY
jgi:hypothetical protein